MHVFVTGATGHIGTALVPELLAGGHKVTALARSDDSTVAAERLGTAVRRGDLTDLDELRTAAAEADGVIHLAFRHDAMRSGDFESAVDTDFAAVRAMGEALEGTGKPFVGATGLLILAGQGRTAIESDTRPAGPRIDAENYQIALAEHGVRSSVVRLSPVTHSADLGRAGFASSLVATALRTGVSGYLGDGENRWSATHTGDTARLFRLALEQAPPGTRLHAVAEEGIPIRDIATAIGEHLDLPVTGIADQDAADHFGFLAPWLAVDAPASSAATRELLDWRPTGPDLLTELGDDRLYNL